MELGDLVIDELLPQRRPFVMVDRLIRFDEVGTACELTVREDNIFTEDGALSVPGMTENIAQTCAARIGYYNKYILKRGISIGYIGAIRNMQILRRPKVGEMITTSIDVVEEIFGMTLVDAVIRCGEEILAEAQMKIAMTEMEVDNQE